MWIKGKKKSEGGNNTKNKQHTAARFVGNKPKNLFVLILSQQIIGPNRLLCQLPQLYQRHAQGKHKQILSN
jgi:hypothetical protein